MRTVSILIRLGLAIALPVLLYYSTRALPAHHGLWMLNNFLWIACAMYFIAYLPIRGLGFKTWVWKVLTALLAIAVWITAFNGAALYMREQTKTVNTQQ